MDDRESIFRPMSLHAGQPHAETDRAFTPERARARVAEIRVTACLNALRAGTLPELVRLHQCVVRRYTPRVLRPVLATAAELLKPPDFVAEAVALWLRWAVLRLCPEERSDFDNLESTAWLDRTSWRPALATACHYGLTTVPEFRDRYRRRSDEAPGDNLCGLWGVGTSTFYRYLDKGKRLLALQLLRSLESSESTMALRVFVHQQTVQQSAVAGQQERVDWHKARALECQAQHDPVSALWHLKHTNNSSDFIGLLHRYRAELACRAETQSLIEQLSRHSMLPRQQFDLLLAQASLARHRGEEGGELELYGSALRIATSAGDNQMLGEVYGALGQYYEMRDADRAFACYEDSARFLQLTGVQEGERCEPNAAASYARTLVRLAWLMISRNDSKSRAVLDQAQSLRERHALSDELAAMAEQTWGEYWRRAGDLRRALEHKHRALNLFERIDDQRSVLVTYINLSLLYGEARDCDRAIAYGNRVLSQAAKSSLAPEMLVSVHGNLGVTYFWQGNYDEAILAYQKALEICQTTALQTPLSNLHLNLAEAFYKRFVLTRAPEDEQRGDMHAAVSMRASPSAREQSYVEVTRKLKSDILGASSERPSYDRLLPEEFAAHFEEMLQVQQQRSALALPSAPAGHVRARLTIARAYLTIATKEREAALALTHKHDLGAQFTAEFEELRSTFNRQLTREEHLTAQWKQAAADMLSDERRAVLLSELLRSGSVNKSGYANVCGLGLATASKHLGMLTDRGLLVQSGRGPSTRYGLPIE